MPDESNNTTQIQDLEHQKVKDYLNRPKDVIRAVQSLRRLGLSVSLPFQTATGQMFFDIDGHALTVAQILRLLDENQLDRVGILQFSVKEKGRG